MMLVNTYLVIYGAIAIGHIALQIALGSLEHRRQRRRAYLPSTPSVTVVVPAYNEDPALLHRCLLSIDRQDYPAIDAIVVDDGSLNVEELLPVHDEFSSGRFRVVLQPDNTGKRDCQAVVFEQALGDVVITIDSDTVLTSDAIRTLVRRFEDPDVGAVTGNVEVTNKRQNLLTRLIGYRYWMAFNQERAAQSYFGVVMCASGPFSAYRRTIIDEVRDAYISQRFLGRRCTFGDDRHLTNLVLGLGYDVVYDEGAVARTRVPHSIRGYLRQQNRWNKSFYREILWTAKFVHKRNAYMGLDLGLQAIMPFALLVALGLTAWAAFVDPSSLWRYGAIVAGIGFVRSLYGAFRTRSAGFLLFVLYGFIHVFLLIPVRLYALATIGRPGWGTRPDANGNGAEREQARRGIVRARSSAGRADAGAQWERVIRGSVAAGESFCLYWQPVRTLWSDKCGYAEVLLRLRHLGQVLPPVDFLPIAERHGLMGMVDEWVVRETIGLLALTPDDEPVRLEVNLSADSVRDATFTTQVRNLLDQRAVAPRRLVLAIPERVALEAPAAAAAFAHRARSMGCLIALDQFGEADQAGDHGCAERLVHGIPLDFVKLTGSIVRRLPFSDTAQETLRRLLAVARRQGLETIAVFAGDEETTRVLTREGVEYAQGFHIGVPSPVSSPLAEITAHASELQGAVSL